MIGTLASTDQGRRKTSDRGARQRVILQITRPGNLVRSYVPTDEKSVSSKR
jgi:hypothetical protein